MGSDLPKLRNKNYTFINTNKIACDDAYMTEYQCVYIGI